MTFRCRNRFGIVLLIFSGIASTVALMLYALEQNIDLFYTPTELVKGKKHNGKKPEIGQRLRVGGIVVDGSLKRDVNSLKVVFELRDEEFKVTVIYDGILPDLFRDGQGIVAQGILVDRTTFEAFEVLAKHDEKYMPIQVAEAMKKTHKPLQYSEKQKKGNIR
ncbi:cytochrome c-type biogenesis protein E [Candidatus Photodesmus blepharus]|uniref:Cytochrome c-type biogenesis protein CcmE n=1 Tax=Candidatus Photodesmus blepharonis TaxID=1179155 RepID=A0A084CMX6_9GAMM|nr:cytochrome c maturation protein CcmE [Candidatus Photodesmus blepharus]KEY91155.1 cytochrome c-type biogenesis protein E [Candidatus Photodesmus blepharus]